MARRPERRGQPAPEPDEAPLAGQAEAEAILAQMASALFPVPAAAIRLDQLTWGERTGAGADASAPETAEARLRAAEQKFRTLVEQIPAVTFMAVLGEGMNEVYVSPHIEALLGYSQKEWLEDPFLWYERLHPEDREMWNEEFTRGCLRGGPFRADCRFLARDGRVVWVHGEARIIKDDLGRPTLLQGVAFDITEVKQAHQVLLERAITAARQEESLAIAQRVQTAILPRKIAVPGLEIAARMIPASEVGGDYYDVLRVDDGCWIAIGDVSGHGLDAGLVMLMLQSAVLTTVTARPHATPAEVLQLVNLALVHNVRGRLGARDHVTMSLLRYTADGRIVFAGAHEEMILVRRKSGAAEMIATPGPWLGARQDIGVHLVDSALQLEDGDLLVLYTDGVTEARNARGQMFDLDRLVAAVQSAQHKPALLIRDNILTAVRRFMARQHDDITLMVIRYRAP
ncbi:MAG TPA: SpoIIE family protein phosphatase [Kofleriaceae bacterium]|nr:SpoIIE family protein phosphatase [Kofleriaceae bacterium]